MAIKLIVTDLDGTLLSNKKVLTDKTKQTLIKAQQQGIRVVLATGRNYRSLEKIYKELKIDEFKTGAIIGVNGQETYFFDDGSYEKGTMLTGEESMKLVRFGSRLLFEVMVMNDHQVKDCISKALFFCKKIAFKIIHQKVTENFEGQMDGHIFITTKDVIDHDVNKVGYSQIPLYTRLLLPYIRKKLSNDYDVLVVSKGWLEIMPKGVNKGAGLEKVMEHFKIEKEEVMVFGDGENDISMLEMIPNSYAPANALASVKAVANYSCFSNEDEGVACVVESLLQESVVK